MSDIWFSMSMTNKDFVQDIESSPLPSLRESFMQHITHSKNYKGQPFIAFAVIDSLVNEMEVSRWIETHPLHRPSEQNMEQEQLISMIIQKGKLLFVLLVIAQLEHLALSIFSRGMSDDSLFEIGSLWKMPSEEEHRLSAQSTLIAPVFKKSKHLLLHERIVLPFITRGSINHGAFGMVYRVEIARGHLEGYEEAVVAEKCIRPDDSSSEESWAAVMREAETLRNREHPNVVPLLASFTLTAVESEADVRSLHLLFPLADEDLADWMARPEAPRWLREAGKEERRTYLYRGIYSLVSALSFIHRKKGGTTTAHHDLKPKNILVIQNQLKIADLGHSHLRSVDMGSETEPNRRLGTYEYHPPEYWQDDGSRAVMRHGRAFDVWSMGCIIVELATLIVFGWEAQKVREFRSRRRENKIKGRPSLAQSRGRPDDSFHNNLAVVEQWIDLLLAQDGSRALSSTLEVARNMMNSRPTERLYSWEAELDLYNIQYPDDDRLMRLEKGALCVQPPAAKGISNVQTPLHRAAWKGDLERILQLIEAGWPLMAEDSQGLTILEIASRSGNSKFYSDLLQSAKYQVPNPIQDKLATSAILKDNILSQTIRNHDLDTIKTWLLVNDINELTKKRFAHGNTMLHYAAQFEASDIAKYLLQQSSDAQLLLSARNSQGRIPLHLACLHGSREIIELFGVYDQNIRGSLRTKDDNGDTPRALAAKQGFPD